MIASADAGEGPNSGKRVNYAILESGTECVCVCLCVCVFVPFQPTASSAPPKIAIISVKNLVSSTSLPARNLYSTSVHTTLATTTTTTTAAVTTKTTTTTTTTTNSRREGNLSGRTSAFASPTTPGRVTLEISTEGVCRTNKFSLEQVASARKTCVPFSNYLQQMKIDVLSLK